MVLRLRLVLIVSLGAVAGNASPQFGDIARFADGSVHPMALLQAQQHCCQENGPNFDCNKMASEKMAKLMIRLPSAREFAQFAATMGAAGILEAAAAWPRNGNNPVSVLNADWNPDEFYFSNSGYIPPSGDIGIYNFWSSSVVAKPSPYGYCLNGKTGDLDPTNMFSNICAVRCVIGR